MKHRFVFLFLTLTIASFCLALANNTNSYAVSGSDFNAGRIIDDSVFYNKGSMTAQQIQAFLESKNPNCDYNGTQSAADWGYPNITHAQLAQYKREGTNGFQQDTGFHAPPYKCLTMYTQATPQMEAASSYCEALSAGTRTAAQIIKDVAVACGINPQVLVILLEKEQSLVTDNWPLNRQLRHATGFACPDTAPCNPAYEGFFYQVYNAARQFKVYQAHPTSYNYQAGRDNNIYWHPDLGRCGSSTVYIQNQATAALYIYTPYRPNQAALNNLYGMGDSCSAYGNRNFWRIFSDWFTTTYAPTYGSEPAGQSTNPRMIQGKDASMYMRFKNTGNLNWYDTTSANANNAKPVKLGTDLPLNRNSPFSSTWPSSNRAAVTFGKVLNADGTLAEDQHIAKPGQIAEFWFKLSTSLQTTPGVHQEALRPIVEGHGPTQVYSYAYFTVTVDKANYTAQPVGQSGYPTIIQGQSGEAYISYKNSGNVSWYDHTSAGPNSQLPVRLGTDSPLNRSSKFGSSWTLGPTRAAENFDAVYESDGTTLAANQHIVQPGQIVKFAFGLNPGYTTNPGYYSESFRPIVEGLGPMNNTGTWLGVTVQKAVFNATPVEQSSYPTIRQGESAPAYISYKNTGNVAWYDHTNAALNGQLPVRLGTDSPLNRSSKFGSSWTLGPTRAANVFGAVYEADGVTPAEDQHIVQPGQIVRMSFDFTVPGNNPTGFYSESFRPIVEGLGPMNNTGTWLGVTVQAAL